MWAPPQAISLSIWWSKAEQGTGLHWESKLPSPSLPKSPLPHTAANLFPELLENHRVILLLQVSELKPIMNSVKRLRVSIALLKSISVRKLLRWMWRSRWTTPRHSYGFFSTWVSDLGNYRMWFGGEGKWHLRMGFDRWQEIVLRLLLEEETGRVSYLRMG